MAEVLSKFNAGNLEGAEIGFKQILEKDAKNYSARYYLGETFFMMNEYKMAMEQFNESLKLNPTFAKSLKGRGRIKAVMEDYKGSIHDFTAALKSDPEFGDAYFNRALSYLHLNELPLAIDDLGRVIELNPSDYQAYVQRGKAWMLKGNKDAACKDWSKAGELGHFKIYDTIKKNCN